MKWHLIRLFAALALIMAVAALWAPASAASMSPADAASDPRYAPYRFDGRPPRPVDQASVTRNMPDLPKRDHNRHVQPPTAFPGDGDWGLYLNSDSGYSMLASFMGAFTITKPNINNDVTIYAPTLRPFGACLEASFAHWSPAGSSSTFHGLGFYDHCGLRPGGDGTGGWQAFLTINSTTWPKYTLQGNTTSLTDLGVQIFDKWSDVRVYKVNASCWTGSIYNVQTANYDAIATSCGTPDGDGWAMFETWGMQSMPDWVCGNLGAWNINQARGLLRGTNNGVNWAPTTSADVGPSFSDFQPCLNNGSGKWYGTLKTPPTWPMIEWHVCGPTKQECRP